MAIADATGVLTLTGGSSTTRLTPQEFIDNSTQCTLVEERVIKIASRDITINGFYDDTNWTYIFDESRCPYADSSADWLSGYEKNGKKIGGATFRLSTPSVSQYDQRTLSHTSAKLQWYNVRILAYTPSTSNRSNRFTFTNTNTASYINAALICVKDGKDGYVETTTNGVNHFGLDLIDAYVRLNENTSIDRLAMNRDQCLVGKWSGGTTGSITLKNYNPTFATGNKIRFLLGNTDVALTGTQKREYILEDSTVATGSIYVDDRDLSIILSTNMTIEADGVTNKSGINVGVFNTDRTHNFNITSLTNSSGQYTGKTVGDWIGKNTGAKVEEGTLPDQITDRRVKTIVMRRFDLVENILAPTVGGAGAYYAKSFMQADSKVTGTSVEASAITGIAFNKTTTMITISADSTLQDIYNYYKYWMAQDAQMNLANFITANGTQLNFGSWSITVNSSTTLSGTAGFASYATTGTTTNNGTISVPYQDANGKTFTINTTVSNTKLRIENVTDSTSETASTGSGTSVTRTFPTSKSIRVTAKAPGYKPKKISFDTSTNNGTVNVVQERDPFVSLTQDLTGIIMSDPGARPVNMKASNNGQGPLVNMYPVPQTTAPTFQSFTDEIDMTTDNTSNIYISFKSSNSSVSRYGLTGSNSSITFSSTPGFSDSVPTSIHAIAYYNNHLYVFAVSTDNADVRYCTKYTVTGTMVLDNPLSSFSGNIYGAFADDEGKFYVLTESSGIIRNLYKYDFDTNTITSVSSKSDYNGGFYLDGYIFIDEGTEGYKAYTNNLGTSHPELTFTLSQGSDSVVFLDGKIYSSTYSGGTSTIKTFPVTPVYANDKPTKPALTFTDGTHTWIGGDGLNTITAYDSDGARVTSKDFELPTLEERVLNNACVYSNAGYTYVKLLTQTEGTGCHVRVYNLEVSPPTYQTAASFDITDWGAGVVTENSNPQIIFTGTFSYFIPLGSTNNTKMYYLSSSGAKDSTLDVDIQNTVLRTALNTSGAKLRGGVAKTTNASEFYLIIDQTIKTFNNLGGGSSSNDIALNYDGYGIQLYNSLLYVIDRVEARVNVYSQAGANILDNRLFITNNSTTGAMKYNFGTINLKNQLEKTRAALDSLWSTDSGIVALHKFNENGNISDLGGFPYQFYSDRVLVNELYCDLVRMSGMPVSASSSCGIAVHDKDYDTAYTAPADYKGQRVDINGLANVIITPISTISDVVTNPTFTSGLSVATRQEIDTNSTQLKQLESDVDEVPFKQLQLFRDRNLLAETDVTLDLYSAFTAEVIIEADDADAMFNAQQGTFRFKIRKATTGTEYKTAEKAVNTFTGESKFTLSFTDNEIASTVTELEFVVEANFNTGTYQDPSKGYYDFQAGKVKFIQNGVVMYADMAEKNDSNGSALTDVTFEGVDQKTGLNKYRSAIPFNVFDQTVKTVIPKLNYDLVDFTDSSMDRIVALKLLRNKRKIDSTNNQLVIYDNDETTELLRFDLKDSSGTATSTNIFEVDPV